MEVCLRAEDFQRALHIFQSGQKVPFCVIGVHVYIIDLHSGMESMTLTSNLLCTNMEDTTLKTKTSLRRISRTTKNVAALSTFRKP